MDFERYPCEKRPTRRRMWQLSQDDTVRLCCVNRARGRTHCGHRGRVSASSVQYFHVVGRLSSAKHFLKKALPETPEGGLPRMMRADVRIHTYIHTYVCACVCARACAYSICIYIYTPIFFHIRHAKQSSGITEKKNLHRFPPSPPIHETACEINRPVHPYCLSRGGGEKVKSRGLLLPRPKPPISCPSNVRQTSLIRRVAAPIRVSPCCSSRVPRGLRSLALGLR